jgi:imidazolonepropionase
MLTGDMAKRQKKKSSKAPGARKSSPKSSSKSPPAGSPVRLFRGIGALYTLEGAARKGGRHGKPDDLGLIEKAAMISEGGRIVWAGPEKDLRSNADLKQILKTSRVQDEDFKGATVIPAFTECHTHLVHAGNRAGEFERRNQGESYQSIGKSGGGILATVLPTRAASAPALAKIAQARLDRYIRQGVTTVEVKSGYALTVDGEMKMLKAAGLLKGARIVRTFLGAHAIPKEFSTAEAYVDELIEKALPRLKKEGSVCRVDIFVEDGYFSKDLARKYLKAAREHGFDVVVHADQLTRSGGASLAVEMGARSADHLICINKDDIGKLSTSETTCVLLPNSDLYMNCAYPPARALIDGGARVALATDFNPGSAPSQDLALAGVLARVQMKMSLSEVLISYTVGAAHALGLGGELGSLVQSKLCDFSVLQGSLDELFLSVGQMPIQSVYREAKNIFQL